MAIKTNSGPVIDFARAAKAIKARRVQAVKVPSVAEVGDDFTLLVPESIKKIISDAGAEGGTGGQILKRIFGAPGFMDFLCPDRTSDTSKTR